MPLLNVCSVQVRSDRLAVYEDGVRRIARRAAERRSDSRWHAQQVAFGSIGLIHFVSEHADWASLGKQGSPQDLILGLLGNRSGAKVNRDLIECVVDMNYTVSRDRPDLSYEPAPASQITPLSLVTVLRARPGGVEACEELIRNVAEAIPKADDPSRLHAYQTVIGDLRTYWTVRPIQRMDELDQMLPPQDLLIRAFGPVDGARRFRTGIDSLQHAERQMTVLRPELSHWS